MLITQYIATVFRAPCLLQSKQMFDKEACKGASTAKNKLKVPVLLVMITLFRVPDLFLSR